MAGEAVQATPGTPAVDDDGASSSAVPAWAIKASPLLIVVLGSLAARVSAELLGEWAWIGTTPVYWLAMATIVLRVSGWQRARAWYGPSHGTWIWPVLAAVVAFSAIPLLLVPNAGLLLRLPLLTVGWIGFAVVNGTIEEAYWRGFLLTEIRSWPRWLVATYSGTLFVVIHFVMLGAFAPVLFNVSFLVILVAITVVLTTMFIRTGSLRLPTAAHVLNDLSNMNIFVFMGLTIAF
jgi:membrane protease YdiL (CAAX protease family)